MVGAQISSGDRAYVLPNGSMLPFDDKENQPAGAGPRIGAYPAPSPAHTDAADLKSNRKAWRKTPSQPSRPVLRDITPIFKRTAVRSLMLGAHRLIIPPRPRMFRSAPTTANIVAGS